MNLLSPKKAAPLPDGSVSILQQTPWPVQFFNFGKAESEDIAYFNCSLVRRKDGLWLITRRSKKMRQFNHGMNDLVAFKLDNKIPALWRKVNIATMFAGLEHFEDPRSIYHNGMTYISCCNFIIRGQNWTGAHQLICAIDANWNTVKRYDPIYGFNGKELGQQTGNEKNWIWFFHNDVPHLIYLTQPHTVVRCDTEFVPQQTHETTWDKDLWQFGQPRGGTPPVKVGNEYWSFFHSSTPWGANSRQYHMGVYAFECHAPFAVTRISTKPILSGSFKDPWGPKKPLVVFPCGAVLEGGKWFVSIGVNDMASAWIEIPHSDVERLAEPVNKPPMVAGGFLNGALKVLNRSLTLNKTYYHSGNLGDVIYSLYAIKLNGGGKLLIGPTQCDTSPCRLPISREQFELLRPLLETVPYLSDVDYRNDYPARELTADLNRFRNKWNDWPLRQKMNIHTLCKMHCYELGVLDDFKEDEPWLSVENPIELGRIVIHRSRRYNDPSFPWKEIVE